MVSSLVLMLVSQVTLSGAQSRYEMGLRLKELDLAWQRVTEPSRRADAVKAVQASVTSFFSGKTGEVCRALDSATSILNGSKSVAGSGLTIRFQPAVVAPGGRAMLQTHWAYTTDSISKVALRCGTDPVEVEQGKDVVQPMELDRLGFGKDSGDQDVEITIGVGTTPRKVRLSVVKDFDARIQKVLVSTDPIVVGLARLAVEAGSGNAETDVPIAKVLKLAEGLDSKVTKLSAIQELLTCKHGKTTFRIRFPEKLVAKSTLVVAMHGAGGSENLFFEGYGSGKSVDLAMKRGWIFAAPRSSGTSVQDIVAWMKDVRGISVGRVFVIGHSMGGMQAVNTLKGEPKPAALGLFAPATSLSQKTIEGVPVFLAVGDQEMQMLRTMAEKASPLLGTLGQYKSYPNCEHLMVVAEGIEDCYRFLDKVPN